MAKGQPAIRQRAGLAMGKDMGISQGYGKARYKAGGTVQDHGYQKYGKGVRKKLKP